MRGVPPEVFELLPARDNLLREINRWRHLKSPVDNRVQKPASKMDIILGDKETKFLVDAKTGEYENFLLHDTGADDKYR